MIDNNYIPEWYRTPFQHMEYTLTRNQIHMDLLFENMNDVDEFISLGDDAQVNFYSNDSLAIVQISECDRSVIEIHGLLLHEAVHIWQRVKVLMGEQEPSKEFEAYSIQAIAQDLFDMYEQSEVNHGLDWKKTD
ncbi:hypothetical protein B9T31_17340 [Acinetobacter sp. ANC 4558]|uniref:hypothetical protein n=1 Tax=Acinetobacter sp. ANC 4558 TaxID=1977876 RepID=UPI000A356E09|nr:hypothetical protein [Acinetobacter sp. ANC 4558]OTG79063.1 hypothetical protein B9T31_17340 [Acinetobacter sp. ANC 4558]